MTRSKRVSGCVSLVEEAACLIWSELCPGLVMGDADLPHYEAAARAVLNLPRHPAPVSQADPFVAAAIAEDAKWPDPIYAAQASEARGVIDVSTAYAYLGSTGTIAAQEVAALIASLSAAATAQASGDTPEDVLNGIRDALETRGYFHMANGRDIGVLLDEKAEASLLPSAQPAHAQAPLDPQRLIDWTYLYATEGSGWPDYATIVTPLMKLAQRSPTQDDADRLKIGATLKGLLSLLSTQCNCHPYIRDTYGHDKSCPFSSTGRETG